MNFERIGFLLRRLLLILLVLLLLLHLLQFAQELFRRLDVRLLTLIFLALLGLRLGLLFRAYGLWIPGLWSGLLLLFLRLFLCRLLLVGVLLRNGHVFRIGRLLLGCGRLRLRVVGGPSRNIRPYRRLRWSVRSSRQNDSLHRTGLSRRTQDDVVVAGTVQKSREDIFGLSRADMRDDSVATTHWWLLDGGSGHSPYSGEDVIHRGIWRVDG